MRYLLALLMIFCASTAFSATGDILATDLHATSSVGYLDNSSGSGGIRHVRTSGCYSGGTGECIEGEATYMGVGDWQVEATWFVDIADTQEITIVYYERLLPVGSWPLDSGFTGGVKSMRPYTDAGDSNAYFGATKTMHDIHGIQTGTYQSQFDSGTQTINTDYGTGINDYICTWTNSPTVATCTTGSGTNFSLDGGTTAGMGSVWRKMRVHIKVPTSPTSNDGAYTLWIDENLIYTLTDVDGRASGNNVVETISFNPIAEATTAFSQWYDEITVYEGYVPPEGAPVSGSGSTAAGSGSISAGSGSFQ